ncbi:MAG: GrpB family protein [Planctomycetota bacterium]|jgi:GrpB-like predicted nucleotidyltransferase (UPF0157 family)
MPRDPSASPPVEIVDHDPAWPDLFAQEAPAVATAFGSDAVVEHMGSTAVPGLAAKPIVDLMVGLEEVVVDDRLVARMAVLGYHHRGERGIPGRQYFEKGDPRSHHVHAVPFGGAFWTDHLLFRDYLRAHPDEVEAYERTKRDLAKRFRDDRQAYSDGKTPFIEAALERARAWRAGRTR